MATKKKKQIAVVLEHDKNVSDGSNMTTNKTAVVRTTDILISVTDIMNIQSAKENEQMINRTNDLFDI